MQQLDLGPEEFSRHDPKTGKLQRRLSKRFCRNYALVLMAVLAFIWWHSTELSSGTLFGVTALFAFVAGVLAQEWLRDVF